MQAAPPQQQQLLHHPGHHQQSQIQAQGGMPAPQDGYGVVAGLQQQQQQHQHALSGQKRDSSGATVQHGSHGAWFLDGGVNLRWQNVCVSILSFFLLRLLWLALAVCLFHQTAIEWLAGL
jgi:hypothetical protein